MSRRKNLCWDLSVDYWVFRPCNFRLFSNDRSRIGKKILCVQPQTHWIDQPHQRISGCCNQFVTWDRLEHGEIFSSKYARFFERNTRRTDSLHTLSFVLYEHINTSQRNWVCKDLTWTIVNRAESYLRTREPVRGRNMLKKTWCSSAGHMKNLVKCWCLCFLEIVAFGRTFAPR